MNANFGVFFPKGFTKHPNFCHRNYFFNFLILLSHSFGKGENLTFYTDFAFNGTKWSVNKTILITFGANTIPRTLVTPLFGPNPKILKIVWENVIFDYCKNGAQIFRKCAIDLSYGFLEPFWGEQNEKNRKISQKRTF